MANADSPISISHHLPYPTSAVLAWWNMLGVAVQVHLRCNTIDLGSVITNYDSSQTTRSSELMEVPLSKEMYVWWVRRRPLAKAKALSEISQCVLVVDGELGLDHQPVTSAATARQTGPLQDERPMRGI